MERADFVADSEDEDAQERTVVPLDDSTYGAEQQLHTLASPAAIPAIHNDQVHDSKTNRTDNELETNSIANRTSGTNADGGYMVLEYASRQGEDNEMLRDATIMWENTSGDDLNKVKQGQHDATSEKDIAMDARNASATIEEEEAPGLRVGDLVEVDSRTWPGINKLGGSGRIVKVHNEEGVDGEPEIFYDVRYVLGGFEKKIESEYVHLSGLLRQERQAQRVRYERIFYHDEFAEDPYKKKKGLNQTVDPKHLPDARDLESLARQSTPPIQRKKRRRAGESNSRYRHATDAASDGAKIYSENDDSENDEPHVIKKLIEVEDDTFENDVNMTLSSTIRQHHRYRHHKITVSDSESDVDSNSGHQISTDDHNADHNRVTHDHNNGKRRVRRRHRARSTKKARYIGGYYHHGDDPDSTFIQPEDNATSLPDDVAQETQFQLGKTKADLRVQLKETSNQLRDNLEWFSEEKELIDQKMRRTASISADDLSALYRRICGLEDFVRQRLIHAGEDVMNMIIRELINKRGTVPDSIELLFDERKQTIHEHSVWIREIKKALDAAFKRRNISLPTSDMNTMKGAEAGNFSGTSGSESELSIRSDDENGVVHTDTDEDMDVGRKLESSIRTYVYPRSVSDQRRSSLKPDRQHHGVPKSTFRRQPTKSYATSSTLDDFGFGNNGGSTSRSFKGTSLFMPTNIRLTSRQIPKVSSDPRWNWLKLARQTQQDMPSNNSFSSSARRVTHVSEPIGTTQRALAHRRAIQDDSVQRKWMQIRNKRYQNPPSQSERRGIPITSIQNEVQLKNRNERVAHKIDFQAAEIIHTTSHTMTPSTQPVDTESEISWGSVFDVISGAEHPKCVPISASWRSQLLAFSDRIYPVSADVHALTDHSMYGEDEKNFFVNNAALLRQLIHDLRLREVEFMELLAGDGYPSVEVVSFESTPEWISLLSLEDKYRSILAASSSLVTKAMDYIPLAKLPDYVHCVITEVSQSLNQLVDCESLFGNCQAYIYYFEVAARNAKTTPLMTATFQTYWYYLQVLVTMRTNCDRLTKSSASLAQEINSVFSAVLPVNRVILAAVLFLFDLHLYLPSSHRLDDGVHSQDNLVEAEPTSSSPTRVPALSLWLLLYECFAGGDCSFHPGSGTSAGNEMDFWTLLQTLYRHNFFDHLALSYIKGVSSGGYLRESTLKQQHSACSAEEKLDVMESQLLALQSTWDLCITLASLCDAQSIKSTHIPKSDAKWAFVKDLLHPEMRDFLPFGSPHFHRQSDYLRYSLNFKQHIIQRVLILSNRWHPRSDIIERIVEEIWEDYCAPNDEIVELPVCLKTILYSSNRTGSMWNLSDIITHLVENPSDSTDLLCRVVLTQLGKLEKQYFKRFCQPILNAVKTRYTKTKMTFTSDGGAGEHTRSWNWTSGSKAKSKVDKVNGLSASTTLPTTSRREGVIEERLMISILLVFAIARICLVDDFDDHLPHRPTQPNKSLKRDLTFYCKEMMDLSRGRNEGGVLLSQALYVIGVLVMEKSNEYEFVFSLLNEHLELSVKELHEISKGDLPFEKKRHKLLIDTVESSLHLMRDLTSKLCSLIPTIAESPSSCAVEAVRSSLSYILSTGLGACVAAAIENAISVKLLNVTLEIIQLVLPKPKEDPTRCLQIETSHPNPKLSTPEHDEFDDPDMDEVWANVDLDSIGVAATSVTRLLSLDALRSTIVQLLMGNLRVELQKLVLNFPEKGGVSFQELYAIDVLGVMISTCKFQFSWSLVNSSSSKVRYLSPRLFSSCVTYHPEEKWFSKCFLSESGADQELASLWLMGTLDFPSLIPSQCTFTSSSSEYSLDINEAVEEAPTITSSGSNMQMRYSNYWVMLTDGIIYNVLREDPVVGFKMDSGLLNLLQMAASTCKFTSEIRRSRTMPSDFETLFDLHLNFYKVFCKSAGTTWMGLCANPLFHRQDINRFRVKLMDPESGIFATLPQSYEINLNKMCRQLDQGNHSWYNLSQLFLDNFSIRSKSIVSYHEIDDTIERLDQRFKHRDVQWLVALLRFTYECVDSFLFHCGEMAIGQHNLFFTIMHLMFRQACTAEFSQAEKRAVLPTSSHHQRVMTEKKLKELRHGITPECWGFVESVRLFFARQKYPSLLHWFAQTSEIYQTLKGGWKSSPLRTLLLNVLDPHGPLGIHSYYPIQVEMNQSSEIDVLPIRREAFYLACGLFICRCSNSYQHSMENAGISIERKKRLQQLRSFVLSDFMWETFDYAANDPVCLHETLVPVCQFIRAVLNHCTMNINVEASQDSGDQGDRSCWFEFDVRDMYSCLEWMALFFARSVEASRALVNQLSGLAAEMVALNERQRLHKEISSLLDIALAYCAMVYEELSAISPHPLAPLFSMDGIPNVRELLTAFAQSSHHDGIKQEQPVKIETVSSSLASEDYGISTLRTRSDLLVAMRRLVQTCQKSTDERVRRFVIV